MLPVTIVQSGIGSCAWSPLDPTQLPFQLSVACVVTGTATYSVEYAYDTPPTTAFPDNFVQGMTVNQVAVITSPVSWVRITITGGSGSVVGTVLQAGAVAPSTDTTGSYTFASSYASDLVIDVYERIGWRAAALTPDMMISAQRSFNFVQSIWSNRGVNLWETVAETITLEQGVTTYTVAPSTIAILPAPFIRMWQLQTQTSLTPNFTTNSLDTSVLVSQPSNGLLVGNYVNIATPIAVGGTTVYGFYPVVSTPTPDTYTINLPTFAPLSEAAAGIVPTLTTDGFTSSVTVDFNPNTIFLAGQTFNVQVSTAIGGLTLLGQYLITSATNAGFVIDATIVSTFAETVTMNDGLCLIESQPAQQLPTDRVLYPLSRPDYTSLSVKRQQGMPTSFWFDRTRTPTITFWPAPDANGPYEFCYFKLSQMQDASIQGGSVVDIPYRFMEAYCAACAHHLSMKWRPELTTALEMYSDKMWKEASDADREQVPFYVVGDFSGYFN